MNHTPTPVQLSISSRRISMATIDDPAQDETFEMSCAGRLSVEDGQVTVAYDETEATGMEGSTTRLVFDQANAGLVTMLREGTVKTVLVFEAGHQHICVYETPYMPFEVTVRTYRVINEILERGYLFLDYTVEIRGANLERTRFSLELHPVDVDLSDFLPDEKMPEVPQP